MIQDSKIAYSEIYAIINLMEDQFIDKVPKKIKDFFEEERDKEYYPIIDVNIELDEQNLQRETIVLLAILKLNYWCDSEEEKQEILKSFSDNENLKIKEQQELYEKYNPDNIFKKKEQNTVVEDKEVVNSLSMVEYKKTNFIKKLLSKIRSLLKN